MMYPKADCSDAGQQACTIPECAEVSSTNAPEVWIAFKFIEVKGNCASSAFVDSVSEKGGQDLYYVDNLEAGACNAMVTAKGDYAQHYYFGDKSCKCATASGTIAPAGGGDCTGKGESCDDSYGGNGSNLCISGTGSSGV